MTVNRHLSRWVGPLLSLAALLPAASAQTLLSIDVSGQPRLVSIDSQTGTVTPLADLPISPALPTNDISLASVGSALWIIDSSVPGSVVLHHVDPATGAVLDTTTNSNDPTADVFEAASVRNGVLHVTGNVVSGGNFSSYLLDQSLDGTTTTGVVATSPSVDMDALAFDSAGNGFVLDQFSAPTQSWGYLLDADTGTTTLANILPHTGATDLSFSSDDRLFGLDGSAGILSEYDASFNEVASVTLDAGFLLLGLTTLPPAPVSPARFFSIDVGAVPPRLVTIQAATGSVTPLADIPISPTQPSLRLSMAIAQGELWIVDSSASFVEPSFYHLDPASGSVLASLPPSNASKARGSPIEGLASHAGALWATTSSSASSGASRIVIDQSLDGSPTAASITSSPVVDMDAFTIDSQGQAWVLDQFTVSTQSRGYHLDLTTGTTTLLQIINGLLDVTDLAFTPDDRFFGLDGTNGTLFWLDTTPGSEFNELDSAALDAGYTLVGLESADIAVRPGSGTGLTLSTATGFGPTDTDDVKLVHEGEPIAVGLTTGTGVEVGDPLVIMGELFPTGMPAPIAPPASFPSLQISLTGFFLLVDGTLPSPLGFSQVLLPGGNVYGFGVPAGFGLSGLTLVVQGATANTLGEVTFTDGMLIEIR